MSTDNTDPTDTDFAETTLMQEGYDFTDTMRGMGAIVLGAGWEWGTVVSVLGTLFLLLSIVKVTLDIHYHRLVQRRKQDRDDEEERQRRIDSGRRPEVP